MRDWSYDHVRPGCDLLRFRIAVLANGLGRRLRKNDIRRILRQHNYHRQQLANGMYNIAAANMKKMIINANYDRVGCSLKRCSSNRTLFGCLYRESTESFSSYPLYRPGKACTKCEGDSSFCENGLCDCRKTCHKPFIGSGELNNTTCQCKCQFGMGPNCDEECHNPEQYQDWDICSLITQEECASPDSDERKLLEEFCPEQCSCHVPGGGGGEGKPDYPEKNH
ncbi:uncharacterized protein LOC110457472 [Mizuhopecten yessoensis]|uniref:uncharacterized protein LOC110457472 n=1 Tax=Mizuhopecten yessoensis TaxID=6573 RepID=UPI000B4579A3|nr:uncharacterized protein LOC110457472 [Mizuhopecten yessoensis]